MSQLYKDQIFWIEVDKITPNPYQPRREFNEDSLADLADSIRQYGVMQPLTVSRVEDVNPEGGVEVRYELIAGERRWRASKLAGLHQVPVIVRKGDNAEVKLELAIIENLQREDLNPIDRAMAFDKLANEFNLSHAQIGKKMGKSREYVSNSLRLLQLPDELKQAVVDQVITEGHTRPLLMLKDRPEEQAALFKEIVYKKMSVREAERVARSIAKDKARKKTPDELKDPNLYALQKKFEETLGTRVQIEKNRGKGGKLVIDYFSQDDLSSLLEALNTQKQASKMELPEMADMLAKSSGLTVEQQLGGSQKAQEGGREDQGSEEKKESVVDPIVATPEYNSASAPRDLAPASPSPLENVTDSAPISVATESSPVQTEVEYQVDSGKPAEETKIPDLDKAAEELLHSTESDSAISKEADVRDEPVFQDQTGGYSSQQQSPATGTTPQLDDYLKVFAPASAPGVHDAARQDSEIKNDSPQSGQDEKFNNFTI